MGFPRGSVQGSLKKSSFALLFFPLSQCKMLVWTLGSSLLSVFPEIVSERSWEQGRVGAGVAFPSKLLPLLQPHWSWRNGILFMPGRLNPYLHISILWAIKLLFETFISPLLSFVFTLFCGFFEVSVTQVWEMCWICLLYKGEQEAVRWEASDRSSPWALLQCANTSPPQGCPHRGKK